MMLPVTLVLVFVLLYLALRSAKKTLLVMLSVPLSLTGGIPDPDTLPIEELIEVPLPSLLDEKGFGEMIISRGGREEVVYAYQYGKHTIWGATARILKQFLDLISSLR